MRECCLLCHFLSHACNGSCCMFLGLTLDHLLPHASMEVVASNAVACLKSFQATLSHLHAMEVVAKLLFARLIGCHKLIDHPQSCFKALKLKKPHMPQQELANRNIDILTTSHMMQHNIHNKRTHDMQNMQN